MAEFTGFYFNNIHSSTYHLYRTSDGNRYDHGLIPDFEDRSVSLVGTDGDLYGERRFKATPFTIKIAFDSVTETDLRNIRNWLAEDELKPFQFDERPYKTYYVKVSSRPVLNYLCFNEEDEWGNTIHIYKGEGSITFTAYNPFGYCVDESKVLSEVDGAPAFLETGLRNRQALDFYTSLGYEHGDDFVRYTFKDEDKLFYQVGERITTNLEVDNTILWAPASGLLESDELATYNTFITETDLQGNVVLNAYTYNPGDKDTPFQLLMKVEAETTPARQQAIDMAGNELGILLLYNPATNQIISRAKHIKNFTQQDLSNNYSQNLQYKDLMERRSPGIWNQIINQINQVNQQLINYRNLQDLEDLTLEGLDISLYIDNGAGTPIKSSLLIRLDESVKNGSYLLIDTKKHLISIWNGTTWEGRFDLIEDIPNNKWPTIPRGANRIAFNGNETINFTCQIKYNYIYY